MTSVSEAKAITDSRTLKVLLPSGQIEDWTVLVTWTKPPEMKVKGSLGEWRFTERDLFEGLKALRRKVESLGGAVLCQGSRPNVWPSGMTRDMCAGGRAYVIEPGKTPADLVNIFDPADRTEIGTVAEQEAEYKKWRETRADQPQTGVAKNCAMTERRQCLRRAFFVVEAVAVGIPPILFLVTLFSEFKVWQGVAIIYDVSFVALPVISFCLRKTDRGLAIAGFVTYIFLFVLIFLFPFAMAPALYF